MSATRSQQVWSFLRRHAHFLGPGLVVACGFIDPGNWATDLQAGADYGYKLLFIVLLAGLAAIVLQLLCVRLGAVTSSSLAAQTRKLFLAWEVKYPRWRRWLRCGLYTLYACAEIAIIATDLAELIGTAIALNLLFPKLPLYAGVLITAADTLLVLLFFRSDSGRHGMIFFEIVIVSLVLCVFASFMVLLHLVRPDWGAVFLGFVPSATLVKPGALYTGVGIIGATVMPHAIYLGTSLATVDRLKLLPVAPNRDTKWTYKLPSLFKRSISRSSTFEQTEVEMSDGLDGVAESSSNTRTARPRSRNDARDAEETKDAEFEGRMKQYEKDLRSFDRINWVDLHLFHFQLDTGASLLCFAMIINSAILIVAGAAYFYGNANANDASIKGAHDLLKSYLGNAAAVLFALALLCAGQSASITATLAGQVVSEGFLEWKTSPVIRRAVTRLIGVIPAVIVAVSVGYSGIDAMLIASQVILSIILPTAILPLVYLCSRKDLMTVEGPEEPADDSAGVGSVGSLAHSPVAVQTSASSSTSICVSEPSHLPSPTSLHSVNSVRRANVLDETQTGELSRTDVLGNVGSASATPSPPPARRTKSYASPLWVTILGYILFSVVVLANTYVIIELILGNN